MSPDALRKIATQDGLQVRHWKDVTPLTLAWFERADRTIRTRGRPSLGLQLLLGDALRQMFTNLGRTLREQRVAVLCCVLEKQA